KNQSDDYPTALLDFDGNERASLHLRDPDLNLLHILLQQLEHSDLSEAMRKAVTGQLFQTIDRRRSEWQQKVDALNEELGALRRKLPQQRELCAAQPKKFSKADAD